MDSLKDIKVCRKPDPRFDRVFFSVFMLLVLILSIFVSALIVNPPAIPRDFTSSGTYYHSSGNNAYFAVDHVMNFSQIVINSSYVEFNNTAFNITSPNRINISLDYIKPTMTGSNGTVLVSFYAQTTTGTAHFNISGFTAGVSYGIYKNNISMTAATANATGSIYFNNNAWTTAYFEILLGTPWSLANFNYVLIQMVDNNGAIWDAYTNQSDNHMRLGVDEDPAFASPTYYWDNTSSDGGAYGYRYHFQESALSNGFTENCTVYFNFTAYNGTHPTEFNDTALDSVALWSPDISLNTPMDGSVISVPYADLSIDANVTNGGDFTLKFLEGDYFTQLSTLHTTGGTNGTYTYNWSGFSQGLHEWCVEVQTNDSEISGIREIGTRTAWTRFYEPWGQNNWTFTYTIPPIPTPTVTTNASTGVEETNATLHGTLTDDGGVGCTVGFNYGLTTGYGTTVSQGGTSNYSLNLVNGWNYNLTFPKAIWDNNNSIAVNDSVLNFVTKGGIYSSISSVFCHNLSDDSWTSWVKARPPAANSLHNISNVVEKPNFEYAIHVDIGTPTLFFNYDLSTVSIPYNYSINIDLLTPGKLYHYRAFSTNLNGTNYGSDMTFLTKPNNPDTASFSISSNTRSLDLTWTKGTGANKTLIVRKLGAYPLTKTDGTIVYNGTGSSYTNTGLTPGVGYAYRAWSYSSFGSTWQFSDLNASACEITKPEGPHHGSANFIGGSTIRINWTKGTGANNTILVKKATGYPTSWTDGTIVYNGTGLFTDVAMSVTSYYRAWSYAAWIINPHLYEISANATNISLPGGGLLINCFDENDHHNLTFNVKVSNQSGSAVYENTSCTNTLAINASLCPQGPNIQVIVSATGYHQRIYTLDIYTGIIYLLNAYLPPETAPGNGTENCELRPYIDSMTITNPAVDAVVTLTYPLEDMISVEIYNASLYGTYGGWIFVASDKYAFTTTSVTINETVLDANTTMARVSYYYNFCEGGVESALYNLRVVETILTSFAQVDQAVENVLVQVKRYINSTGTFVDVSSIFTDANGYVNIYLVPDAHYKIFLNKTGYYDVIGEDLYPTPPNAAGQTEEKIFRIIKIAGGIPPPTYNPLQVITFNGYVDRATHILYVNYSDSLCATTDVNISVYEYNSSTNLSSLLGYFFTTSCNFQHGFNNINNSNRYTVVMNLNHTYFGHIIQSISFDAIAGWMALIAYTTPGYMNALWSANYGLNPFGWSNTIMFLLMVVVLFWGGRDEAPFGFIVLGLIFLIVNLGIGFYTLPTFGASLIPLTFIIAGILGAWRRYNG